MIERSETLARYFKEIRRVPLLSREAEQALFARSSGGTRRARNQLVEANLGYVIKVAKQYRNFGLPFEDLIGEGNLGLFEAAQRFRVEKGLKFITYATWWIRRGILLALDRRSTVVRVPAYHRNKIRELRETEERLRMELGRPPCREEIQQRLGCSLPALETMLAEELREISLDRPSDVAPGTMLVDQIGPVERRTPEDDLILSELSLLVDRAMEELTHQERLALEGRFGLRGDGARTLRALAPELGVSRERVRQIQCEAMKRLRKILDPRDVERIGSAAS